MDKNYIDVLMAHFWASVGSGAGIPFTDDCVQVARDRGYYETIRRNAEKFRSNPGELQAAMRCCLRVGHLAAELAIQEGRQEILGADFEAACAQVEGRIARVRERAAAQNGDIVIQAGVCAALPA